MATCPCDELDFPPSPDIAAGLSRLDRQIGTFGAFRLALLHEVDQQHALEEPDGNGVVDSEFGEVGRGCGDQHRHPEADQQPSQPDDGRDVACRGSWIDLLCATDLQVRPSLPQRRRPGRRASVHRHGCHHCHGTVCN